jgi:hypothetical protein
LSGVGSIHNVTSEQVSCLFLQTVGSSDFKMLLSEQCANIKCYVLLYKSLSGALQMAEDEYDKAIMKKDLVCKWHKCFHYDDPCCSQPSTLTNNENGELVHNVVLNDQ